MILFHGSPERVERPNIKKCYPYNDYGAGFYCTLDKGLACEWACNRPGVDGFCNQYSIDETKLTILNLDEHEQGVLAWLAVLMEHRIFDMEWNAFQVKDAFIRQYHVDLTGADLVVGYRADDSYFSIARAFVSGTITEIQAAEALRLGELGQQVVLRSPKAFRAIRFEGAEQVYAAQWYPRWERRDSEARASFAGMRHAKGKVPGKRIFDLVEV